MHFRPAFPDDFIAALTAIKEAGLTPALLEDYVSLAPGTPPRLRHDHPAGDEPPTDRATTTAPPTTAPTTAPPTTTEPPAP